MAHPKRIVSQIGTLLDRALEKENLKTLAEALTQASELGQTLGNRELCIQAQTLSAALGASPQPLSPDEILTQGDEIRRQIAHLKWLID